MVGNQIIPLKHKGLSWRLDETNIKDKGKWFYLYRAIDKDGYTLDIQLRKTRVHHMAYAFMKRLVNFLENQRFMLYINETEI